MAELSPETFAIITHNAKDWYEYFQSELVQGDDTKDRVATAFANVRFAILDRLLENLNTAVEGTEFERGALKTKLIQVFSNENILRVTEYGKIYLDAEGVAGGWEDFWDGVEYARSVFEEERTGKREPTIKQRAAYWRNVVYPDQSGKWATTIELRQSAWGNLAPYWLILEHGNAEADYAFPKNEAKDFVYMTELEGQRIFDVALLDVEVEVENLVAQTAERFAIDPESYDAFDILEEFYAKGRTYQIYVTKTRRIGVALPETIAGEQRG